MPPEQFTGGPIDGRADLFSLGVILYWMASGEQPFPGETMTAVSYKIVHTEPVPPAKLNPAIPAAMDSLILKCLAKSPADRYQTGEELAQALAQLRTGAKTSSLQATAPMARGTGKPSEETYDVNPGLPPKPAQITATIKLPQQAGLANKKSALLIAAVILLVAMAAGGGYMLYRHRSAAQQPAAEWAIASQPTPAEATASSQQTPVAATTSQPVPAPQATPGTNSTKPSAAHATRAQSSTVAATTSQPAPAPEAAPSTNSTNPSTAPAALAQSPTVAFDPKTLDPKQNARLKLELDHFPPDLAFTVEMDGKVYFKGAAGDKAALENLFVPPGVHEFRVIARGGGGQKASNIASAEFKANKRLTLKAELRPPSEGSSGNSTSLDPAAQIVATLRTNNFFR
jgi:serine/threonine-protein kinase